jgi:hypothetical protein
MAKKATAFTEMSTKALTCRSLGHAWNITLITRKRYDGGVWEIALECGRCKTTRDDVVPAGTDPKTPFNLNRRYGYANQYVVEDRKSWGGPSLLKRNAREVLFKRLQKEGT